jgi:hypothetical protein
MFRIDDPTAAAALPSPEAAATEGYWQEGNPGGGVAATVIRASWLNRVQELLRGVVDAAGVTATKTGYTGLLLAIRRLAGAAVSSVSTTSAITADQAGVVQLSAAAGNITVTLPAANGAAGSPLAYTLMRLDGSANTVTIARAGADLIEGLTSMALPVGARVVLRSDGVSNWRLGHPQPTLGGAQMFTASGTFTVPAGVSRVLAEVWGGGGGGSGTNGGSGGGGGYSRRVVGVTPGSSVTVTVGTGGASGSGGGAAGNGLTSSFGAFCSATGGTGAATGPGGGGAGSGGDVNATGQIGVDLDGTASAATGGLPPAWMGHGQGGSAFSNAAAGNAGAAGAVLVSW